jgi:hypothetical protein
VRHLCKIKIHDFHDLQINRFGRVGSSVAMLECSVGQEVFMDIAYEILNNLIHVVVHHCYPLTPRSTESLQHKLYLALDKLVRT